MFNTVAAPGWSMTIPQFTIATIGLLPIPIFPWMALRRLAILLEGVSECDLQFVSQELFDRLALALILNTDPAAPNKKSAGAVSDFLRDVRAAFPGDDFSPELFQAARWLAQWLVESGDADHGPGFDTLHLVNQHCQDFYPGGGRRPSHTSDAQPLPFAPGERLRTFKANIGVYMEQISGGSAGPAQQ